MSNFMGPMAPPPAAQPQPQALDFKTDPNQRQRFRQFMRDRVSPNFGQAPAMMPNGIGTTMPTPQMAMPQMPMMPQPPMMPSMAPGAGIDVFSPQYMNQPAAPMGFAGGGSVSDALADALSNDIGDYSVDDTMTDLSQTSYNDFDPGGNESFDAAAMDQFRNQQVSDLSNTIGQQIQSSIKSNQQMGTPAPVPQSVIEQMQFENLQNVPSTEPVFSMPNFNLGGMSTSFDLLGDPLTIGFEDGGSVPPRETTIRGQDHMLSYITPDEADILMALGGAGKPGPMGIPAFYGFGDHDDQQGQDKFGGSNKNDDPGNDDSGDFEVNTNTPKGSEPDDPFAGEEGDDFGSGNYGNDDGSFNPSDFVDFGTTSNIPGTLGESYNMNAINRGRQQRQDLAETLANTLENEILDFDAGPVVGDIEVNSIGGVNTGASKGTSSNTDLLGGIDDLLNSLDKTISKVSGPTASEINALENARNQAGTFAPAATSTQTPTVVGNSDAETYDPDLDQATIDALAKDFYGNAGVDQSVIDKISRGSSQSGLESEGVLGALGIGSGKAYTGGVNKRFGTATGPGRLSTVTAEEMDALKSGNAVQRQIYNQLAGIKSAGPVLSQYEPINTGLVDTIFGMTNKPSSAIEVFRAPVTEQKGFKSVNTGSFKDGISGVTGMGNTPGVIGGIMQMFGIDPIVYTGDNRFDPNRPQDDFGGGGDDNVLLPLAPEEVPASTTPNQMPGMGAPSAPTAPGSVLVPSTRTSAPFSGQMPVGYGTPQTGQLNPYSLAEMQRYQQMLARLGQSKSPIGLANGGSVLDAAAGKFLESLTAA